MKLFKDLFLLLAGLTLAACNEDSDNPAFAPDEVYVYDSTASTLTVAAGTEYSQEMIVSPNDGSVECRWTLVDAEGRPVGVVGTDRRLHCTFSVPGSFTLRFEASRGGRSVSKVFSLTVI